MVVSCSVVRSTVLYMCLRTTCKVQREEREAMLCNNYQWHYAIQNKAVVQWSGPRNYMLIYTLQGV